MQQQYNVPPRTIEIFRRLRWNNIVVVTLTRFGDNFALEADGAEFERTFLKLQTGAFLHRITTRLNFQQ